MNDEDRMVRMVQLRDSFPSLKGRFGAEWSAQEVADHVLSAAATGGSSHAAKFVLAVWSGGGTVQWNEEASRYEVDTAYSWPWGCLPFDLMAAFATWDGAHRRAFQAWVQGPFFP